MLDLIDHYTTVVCSRECKTESTEEVIKQLKSMFEEMGKPEILQTDNGGQFVSNKMKQWLNEIGVKWVSGLPRHAWVNGLCEKVHDKMNRKLHAQELDTNQRFKGLPFARRLKIANGQ